jgi:hypothetical protein
MQGFKIKLTNGKVEYAIAVKHREDGKFVVFYRDDGAEVKRIQTRLVSSIEPVDDVEQAANTGFA